METGGRRALLVTLNLKIPKLKFGVYLPYLAVFEIRPSPCVNHWANSYVYFKLATNYQ